MLRKVVLGGGAGSLAALAALMVFAYMDCRDYDKDGADDFWDCGPW